MYDADGGCVAWSPQRYHSAHWGHCYLTFFHFAMVIFSCYIDLCMEEACIKRILFLQATRASKNRLTEFRNILTQKAPCEHTWSRMTEWWWHVDIPNNCNICGTVISNMLIWHFVREKMRKYKEVNQWQPSQFESKCQCKRLFLRRMQIFTVLEQTL